MKSVKWHVAIYIPDSLPVLNLSYKELILVVFIQAMDKTKTQTEKQYDSAC